MVGAPRAQSELQKQLSLTETGAVYKCNLTTIECEPFVFDKSGNFKCKGSECSGSEFTNTIKDYQWLGAAVDGNGDETDRFVVS